LNQKDFLTYIVYFYLLLLAYWSVVIAPVISLQSCATIETRLAAVYHMHEHAEHAIDYSHETNIF